MNKSSDNIGHILSPLNSLGRGVVSPAGQNRCLHRLSLAFDSAITRGVTKRGTRCSATNTGGSENRIAGRLMKN